MRSLMHLSPGIAIAATVSLATGLGAEVIDRVAAVVGLEAVALSEIDTEARLEALLNRKDLAVTDANREELLGRLIDRRLVLQDLAGTPFLRAQPDEIEGQMRQLRSLRYLDGRDFPAALRHYGLTEEDCRAFLDARISFERYVSFRFKTGLDTDNEAARGPTTRTSTRPACRRNKRPSNHSRTWQTGSRRSSSNAERTSCLTDA